MLTVASSHAGIRSANVISGAAHDAMSSARIVPSALAFIPFRDGISHRPVDHASPVLVGTRCDAVLHAVRERAQAR
jgi:N-carbamoyl-L-amino-acid hydrolase